MVRKMSKKIEKEEFKKVIENKGKETRKKTEKAINEYKEFALKGNVLDMAIGVVIGTAFTSIVNTLVSSIITPLLGLLTNKVDLSSLFITLHGPKTSTIAEAKAAGSLILTYGELLNAILYFFIISFTLFIVVKFIKKGKKKEKEVIEKIENCEEDNISKCFKIWKDATEINESDTKVLDKYTVSIEKIKTRYINPLVKIGQECIRIQDISDKAKKDIQNALNFKTKKYVYLDFDF